LRADAKRSDSGGGGGPAAIPAEARERVFVVIAAFNEQARIRSVLEALIPEFPNVVVVDDCSGDRTPQIASDLPVHLLRHAVNLGQGAALQTGTTFALLKGAEVIVHFDADGQHPVDQIGRLLAPILSGEADVALGSRFLGEGSNLPWLKRTVLLPVGRLVNWLFTGLYLSDAHNGFRALNREAAVRLDLRQNRMAHATEILGLIRKYGLRYREVPVVIRYDEFGQGLSGGVKVVRDLLLKGIFR
jgi:polyprenyl-phospho-N-acetylgalactosaminyl synthase